jgi:hypothetical protein
MLVLLIGCGTTDNTDRTPPEVKVLEPENDEIGAPITITVTATDNVAVTGVSMYIDGVFLERKTQPPYTFLWYSDYWGDGRGHLLSATAVDPTGNVGMAKVVNVDVLKTVKPKVEIITPAHQSVVTQQQVLLRWKPIENTKSYTVQITDTTTTDLLIVDTRTTSTSMTVNLPLEGTYRWRVLPATIGNIYGGWTKENVFHRTDRFTSIIGRKKFDALNAIAATSDGGTILAGSTHAMDKGGILVKTDHTGSIQWERYYAGVDLSWFNTVIQTADGGYMAAGQSTSKEFPADRWFVKTNSTGQIQWSKSLIQELAQGVNGILQTADGGYAVCAFGETDSDKVDIVLTKYDSTMEMIWERTIGGKYHDEAFHIAPMHDGGFLLSGVTQTGTDLASDRALVLRIDHLGQEQWRREMRSAGGARYTAGTEHNGNVYVCGNSKNADNQQDALVTAFDSSGNHLWTRTFGGERDDASSGIIVSNNRIAVCGRYAADSFGVQDAWLLLLDLDGKEISQSMYGGKNFDGAAGITAISGGFALTGTTTSFSAGSSDGFLILTDLSGNVIHRQP